MSKSFLKIAYFNLWRRKSRSLLVIAMVAFGLLSMIFSHGLYEGQMVQMISDTIRTGTGQITINKEGYRTSGLLSDHIQYPNNIEQALNQIADVEHITSRLKCEGVISSAKYAQGAMIYGIDINDEANFMRYKKPLIKGSFTFAPQNNMVIIGHRLAEKLKVDVGKKIVLQGQSLDKEITSIGARVAGIVRTNSPDIDTSGVLMNKQTLQKLFKVDGVTEFSILINENASIDTLVYQIQQAVNSQNNESLEVFSWKEIYPLLVFWEKIFMYFIYISYAIVFLVVACGIFFILFISVFERIKEFGILIAVGTPFGSICRILIFESFIMGGLGYFFGALSSLLILVYFQRYGIDLSYFSAGLSDIGMAAVMYPTIKGGYFVLGFIAVFISSLISVAIPLWKLKRLHAVEAIRFV